MFKIGRIGLAWASGEGDESGRSRNRVQCEGADLAVEMHGARQSASVTQAKVQQTGVLCSEGPLFAPSLCFGRSHAGNVHYMCKLIQPVTRRYYMLFCTAEFGGAKALNEIVHKMQAVASDRSPALRVSRPSSPGRTAGPPHPGSHHSHPCSSSDSCPNTPRFYSQAARLVALQHLRAALGFPVRPPRGLRAQGSPKSELNRSLNGVRNGVFPSLRRPVGYQSELNRS